MPNTLSPANNDSLPSISENHARATRKSLKHKTLKKNVLDIEVKLLQKDPSTSSLKPSPSWTVAKSPRQMAQHFRTGNYKVLPALGLFQRRGTFLHELKAHIERGTPPHKEDTFPVTQSKTTVLHRHQTVEQDSVVNLTRQSSASDGSSMTTVKWERAYSKEETLPIMTKSRMTVLRRQQTVEQESSVSLTKHSSHRSSLTVDKRRSSSKDGGPGRSGSADSGRRKSSDLPEVVVKPKRKTHFAVVNQKSLDEIKQSISKSSASPPIKTFLTTKMVLEMFQDSYNRFSMQAAKRRTIKIRKRWVGNFRKVLTIIRLCKNLAQTTLNYEMKIKTGLDLSLNTLPIKYGKCFSLDQDFYKRRDEIAVAPDVRAVMCYPPSMRTLVQLEMAMRELQRINAFSELPIHIQERMVRHAFYLEVGPKRVILRQGHPASFFYIIICGTVYFKKYTKNEQGEAEAFTEGFATTNQSFGSREIISGTLREETAISLTKMKFLVLNGDDYLHIFGSSFYSQIDELPDHLAYLSTLEIMKDFPICMLKDKTGLRDVCALHHFKRNAVITHDSSSCPFLLIIKYGYCKVFVRLKKNQTKKQSRPPPTPSLRAMRKGKKGLLMDSNSCWEEKCETLRNYIQKCPVDKVVHVPCLTPLGNVVPMPVVRRRGIFEPQRSQPLTLPNKTRQFVPLHLLREGEIFGLDQTSLCHRRLQSRAVILVSLGAEVISVSKTVYCALVTSPEAKMIVQRAFIYNQDFIDSKVNEQMNRDVHMEEVLNNYFATKEQVPTRDPLSPSSLNTGQEASPLCPSSLNTGQEASPLCPSSLNTGQEEAPVRPSSLNTGQKAQTVSFSSLNTGQEAAPVSLSSLNTGQEKAPVSPSLNTGQEAPPVSLSSLNTGQEEAPISLSSLNTGQEAAPVRYSSLNTGQEEAPVSHSSLNTGQEEAPVSPSLNTGQEAPPVRHSSLNTGQEEALVSHSSLNTGQD